jgi:hypothetical protein
VYIAFDCRLLFPLPNFPAVPLSLNSSAFHSPYPLPSSVSRKSSICHSCANCASRTVLRDENTGGVGVFFPFWKSSRSHSDETRFNSSSFLSHCCALFCSFLHLRKTQLFYFQAIPHSLPKITGGEGTPVTLISRWAELANRPGRPSIASFQLSTVDRRSRPLPGLSTPSVSFLSTGLVFWKAKNDRPRATAAATKTQNERGNPLRDSRNH